MILSLHFEGWIQVRLATDPDPYDEPRGVSGWTFALAGESDFDRIIRLREPVDPRSPGRNVGVTVRSVWLDDQLIPDHPLIGAEVDLLDNPVFEGRNGILSQSAQEFIHPFHICFTKDDCRIERRDILKRDENGQERPIYKVDPSLVRRRMPVDFSNQSREVAEAIGLISTEDFVNERIDAIQKSLEWLQHELSEGNLDEAQRVKKEIAIRALEKRKEELPKRGLRVATLLFRLLYRFEISGSAPDIQDPDNLLNGSIIRGFPWPIEFWIGGWDTDALCAYMHGKLNIPFIPRKNEES